MTLGDYHDPNFHHLVWYRKAADYFSPGPWRIETAADGSKRIVDKNGKPPDREQDLELMSRSRELLPALIRDWDRQFSELLDMKTRSEELERELEQERRDNPLAFHLREAMRLIGKSGE